MVNNYLEIIIFILIIIIFYLLRRSIIQRDILLWYRQSLEKCSSGIYMWEKSKNKWFWSGSLIKSRGYTEKDKKNAINNFLLQIHPEDRAKVVISTTDALRNKSGINVSYRYITPNGDLRYHRECSSFLPDGNLYGFVTDETSFYKQDIFNTDYLNNDLVTKLPNKGSFDRALFNYFYSEEQVNYCILSFIYFGYNSKNLIQFKSLLNEFFNKHIKKSELNMFDNIHIYMTTDSEISLFVKTDQSSYNYDYVNLINAINAIFDFCKLQSEIDFNIVCAGISNYPLDCKSLQELLSNTDQALQSAKRSENHYIIYDYLPKQ